METAQLPKTAEPLVSLARKLFSQNLPAPYLRTMAKNKLRITYRTPYGGPLILTGIVPAGGAPRYDEKPSFRVPAKIREPWTTVRAHDLGRFLRATIPVLARAADKNYRYAFASAALHAVDGFVWLVAIDGARLMRFRLGPCKLTLSRQALISHVLVRPLADMLCDAQLRDTEVSIGVTTTLDGTVKWLHLAAKSWMLSVSPSDGSYPAWRSVTESKTYNLHNVSRTRLLDAIRRVTSRPHKTALALLRFSAGEVAVWRATEKGEEKLIDTVCGEGGPEELEMCFDPKLLNRLLVNFPGKQITLGTNEVICDYGSLAIYDHPEQRAWFILMTRAKKWD